MKVGNISINSFGNLYLSSRIKEKSKHSSAKKFNNDLSAIKKIIKDNDLNRKKYVNIILDYQNDTFVGIISSKAQGIPMNPGYTQKILPDNEQSATDFIEWVDEWDKAYSPEVLAIMKGLTSVDYLPHK